MESDLTPRISPPKDDISFSGTADSSANDALKKDVSFPGTGTKSTSSGHGDTSSNDGQEHNVHAHHERNKTTARGTPCSALGVSQGVRLVGKVTVVIGGTYGTGYPIGDGTDGGSSIAHVS